MKTAQLDGPDGKPLLEVVMILSPKEVNMICSAIEVACKASPRKKLLKRLKEELDTASIMF